MRIRVEKLFKRYGNSVALDGVSLEIEPGRIVAVSGPNGAGKTTLMNELAGIIPLSGGQVLFDRPPYRPFRPELRRDFLLAQ